MAFTPRQSRFIDEYLIDLNATQAAIRAGYSKKGATVRGAELLANRNIAQEIAKRREERSQRTGIDADWLLRRLADEATADITDLYNENGGLKPVHEWPKIWRQGLVAGLEVEQQYAYEQGEKIPDGYLTKIKLSDRVKRLELIGKHIGVQAFSERFEISKPIVIIKDLGGNADD